MTRVREAALAVGEALAQARKGLVEREVLLELVVLAAVAREHVLVIGPPGTAKSEGVRRVSRALGAKRFEYLLGRFTEPSELFGPIDLKGSVLNSVYVLLNSPEDLQGSQVDSTFK